MPIEMASLGAPCNPRRKQKTAFNRSFMELAGLEPATSWVRSSRSTAVQTAWLSHFWLYLRAPATASPTFCSPFCRASGASEANKHLPVARHAISQLDHLHGNRRSCHRLPPQCLRLPDSVERGNPTARSDFGVSRRSRWCRRRPRSRERRFRRRRSGRGSAIESESTTVGQQMLTVSGGDRDE